MKQDIRKDRKYGLRLKLRIHAGIKHESVEEGPNHHKPLFQISRRLNTVLTVAGHRLLHQVLTPHAVRSPDALRDLLIAEAFSRNFEPQSAVSAGQAILDLLTDALLNLFAMDIRIRIPPDLDSVNVIIKPPVHNRFDNVFLAVEVVVDVARAHSKRLPDGAHARGVEALLPEAAEGSVENFFPPLCCLGADSRSSGISAHNGFLPPCSG